MNCRRERYINHRSPIHYAALERVALWNVALGKSAAHLAWRVPLTQGTVRREWHNTHPFGSQLKIKTKNLPHIFLQRKLNELGQIPFISICHSWMSAVLINSRLFALPKNFSVQHCFLMPPLSTHFSLDLRTQMSVLNHPPVSWHSLLTIPTF